MSKRVDRTGEEKINNFGSKMYIIEYKNNKDITVYFPEYNCYVYNKKYKDWISGKIKCPYERRAYSKGYIGEGEYDSIKNKDAYDKWYDMLVRCYSDKYIAYENAYVCDEWLNFQNFAKWYYDNYYEIQGEQMELDKDILNKGNKVYSPDNCIFAPKTINLIFIKKKINGTRGLTKDKSRNKYKVQINKHGRHINLGRYETIEEAFKVYKEAKEKYIKEVAKEYKQKIPNKLYIAMMEYEVEITD